MFAGSLQGHTETLPLAVYTTFEAQNGLDVALAISGLLVIISLAILLALKGSGLWERSRPPVIAIARARAGLTAWRHSRRSFELPLRSFVLKLALDVEGTVALVGPSGAGKTSVLRAVAGLVKPPSGRIALDEDVWLDSAQGLFRPARRAPGRSRLPGVRALPPHERPAEHRLRREGPGRRVARAVPHLASRESAAGRALGWRAPASRARPGARPRPRRAAARRAPLGARRAHQDRGARRAPGAVARVRPADAARHPRLRGCRVARRPGRRPRRRHAAPDRVAAGARLASGRRVRRLVHRREPAPRDRPHAGGRPDAGRARRRRDRLLDRLRREARSASSSTRGTSRSGTGTSPIRR